MFVPVILGSDKTTVSVATGQNDFYPLYLSIGNVQNHIRRAHKDALVLIGFLPIPKGQPYWLHTTNLISYFYNRREEGYRHRRVSIFQAQPHSQIDRHNPTPSKGFHDKS